MTIIVKSLVPSTFIPNTITTVYTAANLRAVVDKVSIVNTATANQSFTAHVVSGAGIADDSNMVVDSRVVVPGETYLCPELVGQYLDPGTFIAVVASAASALNLRISGREIT